MCAHSGRSPKIHVTVKFLRLKGAMLERRDSSSTTRHACLALVGGPEVGGGER